MPLATIHLISLAPSTSLLSFIQSIHAANLSPLVLSKVIRWIITPTKIDVEELLRPAQQWDILLILPGKESATLPSPISSQITQHWSTTAGIPSRLTSDFARRNSQILHPDASAVPALTGALDNPRIGQSAQTLELSTELAEWIESFARTRAGQNPLSMLNLLAFREGMKESYLKYGKAFAESIGARRGGVAKLVGNIVGGDRKAGAGAGAGADSGRGWDEFALASYPSILHFADMLASEDYQAVNLKYRVPALEDTLILATSEIEIEDLLAGSQADQGTGAKAKL